MNTDQLTRRYWLRNAACGFAGLAAGSLVAEEYGGHQTYAKPKGNQSQATRVGTARRVIFLYMDGGPSQCDTFDYKPELGKGGTMASPFEFRQRGESGLPIAEVFSNLGRHADDLCLLNGMVTESSSHGQAETLLHTGLMRSGDTPSLGSWAFYGLGSSRRQLPGFITVNYNGGASNYGAGFLPAKFQGVKLEVGDSQRSYFGEANAVLPNSVNRHYTSDGQARRRDFIQRMNLAYSDAFSGDDRVEAVIEAFEQGYKMQDSLRNLIDLTTEPEETQALYGIDQDATADFGKQCLLARRLVEKDVRFVQLNHRGWDLPQTRIEERLAKSALEVDKPIAGLLSDLKRRGLLEDTLVVWGGEFGRKPRGSGSGRDHHNRGYTMWLGWRRSERWNASWGYR